MRGFHARTTPRASPLATRSPPGATDTASTGAVPGSDGSRRSVRPSKTSVFPRAPPAAMTDPSRETPSDVNVWRNSLRNTCVRCRVLSTYVLTTPVDQRPTTVPPAHRAATAEPALRPSSPSSWSGRASQIRAVASAPPVTSRDPSDEKASARTGSPPLPDRVATDAPAPTIPCTRHRRAVPSGLALATS